MSDPAEEYVTSLLGAAAALLSGDPTNVPHFERTAAELNAALGTEGRMDLQATISEGDLLGTVYRLGKAMEAMGENAATALAFAAKVAPEHRMPEHMSKAPL